MNGELHEISVAIGRLEAQAQQQLRDHERTHATIESIAANLEQLTPLPARLAKVEAIAADYEAKKKLALGLTLGGGIAGGGLLKALLEIFGRGGA